MVRMPAATLDPKATLKNGNGEKEETWISDGTMKLLNQPRMQCLSPDILCVKVKMTCTLFELLSFSLSYFSAGNKS